MDELGFREHLFQILVIQIRLVRLVGSFRQEEVLQITSHEPFVVADR